LDGGAKWAHGVGKTAEMFERVAFLMMGFSESGIEAPGVLEIVERFNRAAERAKGEAAIQEERSDRGIGGDGLREKFDGANRLAFVLGDEAEQVERVGVLWFGLQHLAVERGGGGEVSGTVKLDRAGEDGRDRCHLVTSESGETGRRKIGARQEWKSRVLVMTVMTWSRDALVACERNDSATSVAAPASNLEKAKAPRGRGLVCSGVMDRLDD
jgi:hypothetical protein